MFVRSWCIPKDVLPGFFVFWESNKAKMRLRGFAVEKDETGEWYLKEWQKNQNDFSTIGTTEGKKPIIVPDKSSLELAPLKYEQGLRKWQPTLVSQLSASIRKYGAAIDGSDTGCHTKGQGILMFDGSTRNVETLRIGDRVMGWKGPQIITKLHHGFEQMYNIVPVKGPNFSVNGNHLLTVKLTNGPSKTHKWTGGYEYGKIYDIKVKDYINLSKTTKHAMKIFTVGVDSWNEKGVTIDPYLLGALLGDGGLSTKDCISFTSNDEEMWEMLNDHCKKNNWTLGNTSQNITKRITSSPDLFRNMRSIGLFPVKCENRFIPTEYKINTRQVRLQILAGLIDTDGSYDKGCYSFTSKSKNLRDDTSFIARSLGFFVVDKSRVHTCKNNGKSGTYHSCSILGNINQIPCKIKRKIAKPRIQKKDASVVGFKVEKQTVGEFYGFSLDGDGRYLMDNFFVTHNSGKTYVAVGVARELGLRVGVVCPKAVITSWKRVIENHFGMPVEFVINYEGLRTGKYKKIATWEKTSKKSTIEKFVWKIKDPQNVLIIFDESHKLKDGKTQNSEMAVSAHNAGFKILCCSATSAINPIELKTVGKILGLHKGTSKAFNEFLLEHDCEQGRFGWQFNGSKNALKKLNFDLFKERGARIKKTDIPDFPDCDIIAESYDMDEKSKAEINQIFFEMGAELRVLAQTLKSDREKQTNALTAQLRARQQCELLKVPLFVDMAEEAIADGMSVVIIVNFTDTIKALSDKLNTKCMIWGGDTENRQKHIDDFQADKSRIILVNISAGGAGLSLHDLNGQYPRIALISPGPSAVGLKQALGRVWRAEAKTKAMQKIIFVAGTQEEQICEKMKTKLNNMDLINDGDLSTESIFKDTY